MKSILSRVAFALTTLALASCSRGCSDPSAGGPATASSGAASHQAGGPAPRTARLDGAKTTREILGTLAKDCLPCAEKNGCLDRNQQGGVCEGVPGTSASGGEKETAVCLESLRCIFTTKCANSGEETSCLCGKTDVMDCMEGKSPPTGPCVTEFKNDFGESGKAMYDNFITPEYGAGQANRVIQCVMPLCPSCRIP